MILTCRYNAPMNRSNVEEIKARLPIEDVLAQYVKLEKAGKSLKAKCPFHHEKSASFFVSPERQGYYCFGCGAKGDIFSFVEQFEGLDFKGALKVLAERAGVKLVFDQKADSERDKLFAVMEEAAKYFEAELAKSVGAGSASEYVTKRGVKPETRAEFRIGFAPEGWRNLYTYLRAKNYPNDIIEKAGLAKRAEDNTGNYYDRFRGRVMFPISDSSGRVIAFSGRILKDDGQSAKYLNSPDTPLFDKSSVLYGLDKAKSFLRRLDYSILVEGQMDLIMSHQAGIKNAVAASGTALTDAEANKEGVTNNLGLLRRLSNNVIIAFDSDNAGKKAAMRAARIALSLGMDVKIADITGGKDPADLVNANPEDWKNVLRAATPIVEFELNNVLREFAEKGTDKRKMGKELHDRVYPFIVAVESETDKAYFVKMVSGKADLPEQAIWQDVRAMVAKHKSESGKISSQAQNSKTTPAGIASANTSDSTRRVDLVQRRLFGLLELMNKAGNPKVASYIEEVKKITGDKYEGISAKAKEMASDIAFEAESFYASDKDRWDLHVRELIYNLEEDLINEDLISTMGELRVAEKAGNGPLVAELAKKCQVLSIRKSEVTKNRN